MTLGLNPSTPTNQCLNWSDAESHGPSQAPSKSLPPGFLTPPCAVGRPAGGVSITETLSEPSRS